MVQYQLTDPLVRKRWRQAALFDWWACWWLSGGVDMKNESWFSLSVFTRTVTYDVTYIWFEFSETEHTEWTQDNYRETQHNYKETRDDYRETQHNYREWNHGWLLQHSCFGMSTVSGSPRRFPLHTFWKPQLWPEYHMTTVLCHANTHTHPHTVSSIKINHSGLCNSDSESAAIKLNTRY